MFKIEIYTHTHIHTVLIQDEGVSWKNGKEELVLRNNTALLCLCVCVLFKFLCVRGGVCV